MEIMKKKIPTSDMVPVGEAGGGEGNQLNLFGILIVLVQGHIPAEDSNDGHVLSPDAQQEAELAQVDLPGTADGWSGLSAGESAGRR